MDISVPSTFLGKKILDLQVARSCKGIIGSWSASLVSEAAPADVGDDVSLPGVFCGVVTMVQDMGNGSWRVEGSDNGVKLMKSVPSREALSPGPISSQISQLVAYCGVSAAGIQATTPSGVTDCRTLIQGSTCAEAIVSLARLGGSLAIIDNEGRLVVKKPASFSFPTDNILSKDGRALETDGYASGVFCTVHRKGKDPVPLGATSPGTSGSWVGETISGDLTSVTEGGITLLEPLGLLTNVNVSGQGLGENAEAYSIQETYQYDTETELVEEAGQEYRVFRWRLRSRTKNSSFSWKVGDETFSTSTEEVFSRVFDTETSLEGDISCLKSEELTVTSSVLPAKPNALPPPPFTRKVIAEYSFSEKTRKKVVRETEYVLSETGKVGLIQNEEGSLLTQKIGEQDIPIALPVLRKMEYVQKNKQTVIIETASRDGECLCRITSQCEDNEALWAEAENLLTTLDPSNVAYQDIRGQILSSPTTDVVVYPGGFSIPAETWDEKRFSGRRYVGGSSSPTASGPVVPSTGDCPYFDAGNGDCLVATVAPGGDSCLKTAGTSPPSGWNSCIRYLYMKETIAGGFSSGVLAKPVFGKAGGGKLWAEVSVYLEDEITDAVAQGVADAFASSILSMSQTGKGITESFTIPLDTSLLPNGGLIAVDHDFKALKTSLRCITSKEVPECLLMTQPSSVASALQANNRFGQEAPGIVQMVGDSGSLSVLVRGRAVMCRSRVGNVGAGCAVLVYLPPGAEGWGVVRDVL